MFTQKDLNRIGRRYSIVKGAGCCGVTLQSKNTRHCWHITSEEYGSTSTCTIYHTHHEGTPMHRHGHGRNITSCMSQIKSHDEYQLKKDARKRYIARDHRYMARTENEALITV